MARTSLPEIFDEIIEKDYALNKNGSYFEIVEDGKGSTNTHLKIGGGRGFAFSLDLKGRRHPWSFFVPNPSISGLVSVCDGIVVLSYQSKNYIIVLDLKSKSAGTKAQKQISSGIYLCDWICKLLKMNSHFSGQFSFIGLICKSRSSASKSTTRRGLTGNVHTNKDNVPVVTLSNPGTIHIKELLELIDAKK